MKLSRIIIPLALIFASIVGAFVMLCIVVLLFSEQGHWDISYLLSEHWEHHIARLQNDLERNPTNQVVLDKVIKYTESPNPFKRCDAIGVLCDLSYHRKPSAKLIHAQVLPVFVRALDYDAHGNWLDAQPIRRAGLEGLENLGPYAVSAIPDVKRKLSDPDPVIQYDAQETLDELEKFQTNGPNKSLQPTATAPSVSTNK
jgi:hypothetical protein